MIYKTNILLFYKIQKTTLLDNFILLVGPSNKVATRPS